MVVGKRGRPRRPLRRRQPSMSGLARTGSLSVECNRTTSQASRQSGPGRQERTKKGLALGYAAPAKSGERYLPALLFWGGALLSREYCAIHCASRETSVFGSSRTAPETPNSRRDRIHSKSTTILTTIRAPAFFLSPTATAGLKATSSPTLNLCGRICHIAQLSLSLQLFGFERISSRKSRNSFGPLRSRRFRCCRSSSGADGSISLSSCALANS